MLLNDFFRITERSSQENKIRTRIEFNPGHAIFKGHFPGQPVVPGVCMVQIVKEILETELKKEYWLVQADHIKFLSVIDPNQTPSVFAEIQYEQAEENQIRVSASLVNDEIVYLKMRALFSGSIPEIS